MATFVRPSRRLRGGRAFGSRRADSTGPIGAASICTGRKSGRLARMLLVAAALLTPRGAAAQSGAEAVEDVRQNARIHAGPLYATPSVMLKEFGIDNNVFNVYGEN